MRFISCQRGNVTKQAFRLRIARIGASSWCCEIAESGLARNGFTREEEWKMTYLIIFATWKRYGDPFCCNWRFIRCIKRSHMFNFDAEITQANEFSAFDEELFLRRWCIMNITSEHFMSAELHCELFISYTARLNCDTSLCVAVYYMTYLFVTRFHTHTHIYAHTRGGSSSFVSNMRRNRYVWST